MNENTQPVTVLISVTPDLMADAVKTTACPCNTEDIQNFINRLIQAENDNQKLTDNWVFRYEFPDTTKIPAPAVGSNTENYFKFIRNLADEAGIVPSEIISLRDALYCQRHGIDLFSPEGQHRELIHAPGYKTVGTNFGIYKDEGHEFPTCRAVDIGPGVLLYDLNQSSGRDAYNNLLQRCADNYFSPDMQIDKLRFFDIYPFLDTKLIESHPSALNFNFNHHGRDYTFKNLLQDPLLNKNILKEGMLVKEYDMRPISENYSLFLTGENLRYQAYTKTFDISILDEIVRNGYPTQRLSPEWYFICSYTRQFRDLADQIVLCEDPKQMTMLQQEAKGRAQIFLERDFPQRRQLSEEQRQSLVTKQTHYLDIPSENFNRAHKL